MNPVMHKSNFIIRLTCTPKQMYVEDYVCLFFFGSQTRPRICHFFSTNVLLGSIFLHMKARKLWHIWPRCLHHTHAICGEFQISPHLPYEHI